MKTSILALSLSLAFTANAFADQPAKPLNKGLVVAITEPGKIAADTAWLLSDQASEGRDAPVLLVLNDEKRDNLLKSLSLKTNELPALVYLDSNGKERSRVVRVIPTTKFGVKTASID